LYSPGLKVSALGLLCTGLNFVLGPPRKNQKPLANGEDVKTVQELLRHASSRITLEVYIQAVTSHKRASQSEVVRMMVPDVGTKEDGTEARTAR
jgi:hypothetical protein